MKKRNKTSRPKRSGGFGGVSRRVTSKGKLCIFSSESNTDGSPAVGTLETIWGNNPAPWSDYAERITSVEVGQNVRGGRSLANLFEGLDRVVTIDLRELDTSSTTDMSFMFAGYTALSKIKLASLNTSLATHISGMFRGCSSLSYIDLSSFDTASLRYSRLMFEGCPSLRDVIVGPKCLLTQEVFGQDVHVAHLPSPEEMRGRIGTAGWRVSKKGKLTLFPLDDSKPSRFQSRINTVGTH